MASVPPLTSKSSINSCSNIFRIVLILASTITIFLCVFRMFTVFICHQEPAVIVLNDLMAPSFNVSNLNLSAIWLANLTVYNPNAAFGIQMKQIEASILYKHDTAVSFTSMDDFELGFQERREVFMKFVTTGDEGDQPIVEYPLLREIEKDMITRKGKVRFRMRLEAMTEHCGIELLGWKVPGRMIMNSYTADLDVHVGDGRGITVDSPMDASLLMNMVADR